MRGSEDHSHEGLQWLETGKLDKNWPEKYNRPGEDILAWGAKTIDA